MVKLFLIFTEFRSEDSTRQHGPIGAILSKCHPIISFHCAAIDEILARIKTQLLQKLDLNPPSPIPISVLTHKYSQ